MYCRFSAITYWRIIVQSITSTIEYIFSVMTFALCIVNNFLYIYLIFNTKTVFCLIYEIIRIDYIFLKK